MKDDKDTDICSYWENDYYIDTNDGKCKSNQKENDNFIFCKEFTNKCIKYEDN